MLFNPKYKDDIKKAEICFKKMVSGDSVFEIIKKNKKRTITQNAYLHKLFSLFGIEYGLDLEETKQVVKEALKYTYTKKGRTFLSKTSKMDTKELTIFIDKFRTFAEQQGCYLPSSDEYNGRFEHYDNEIERHKRYL